MQKLFTLILTTASFLLLALFTLPPKAQAMPTLWDIELHKSVLFTTNFTQLPDGSYQDITSWTRNGPGIGGNAVFRFSVESAFGNATSLTNIQQSGQPGGWLCALGNCFTDLSAAGLFLGDNPRIVGLATDTPCCVLEEIAFDGWFTDGSYNWEDPRLPTITSQSLRDVRSGEFVQRTVDLTPGASYREIDFGVYQIRPVTTARAQMPEPSTLILFGVGLVALFVRFRKKFTR